MNALLILLMAANGLTGKWQTYTNTNFVNDLAGDGDTLFLATPGGLQLFRISDTTFLQAYTNSEGLPANTLRCCATDKSGYVWIGTEGAGIVVFDPHTETFHVHPPDPLPLTINCIEVSGDTVLFGSDNGAWLIDTKGTNLNFEDDVVIPITLLPGSTVLSIGVGQDFWVGTNQGVDRVLRDLTVQHYPIHQLLLGDSVKAIVVKDDTAFIATEWCIARFADSTFVQVAPYDNRTHLVYGMTVFNHLLHVVLDFGLTRWTGAGFETLWWTDCRSLLSRADLWVGFGGMVRELGNGLGRQTAGGTQNVFVSRGMASNMVAAAVLDTSGEIYACHFLTIGGFRGNSCRQADGSWEMLRDTIAHSALVARDYRNRIWFGHWGIFDNNGGLSSFDPATGEWKPYTWGPLDYRNVIAGLGIDRFDTKWVFNQSGEIVAVDSTGGMEYFRVPGVIAPTGGGYDFAFDDDDRVWFGTMNGLAMLDWRGTLHDQTDDTTAVYNRGLQSTNVASVTLDQRDRPWVATSQGAAVLENGAFRLYTTLNSGILSNTVIRVRTDPWGNIWFLTDRGISILNPGTQVWSQPDQNRGLVPNLSRRPDFYTWLTLDQEHKKALIASKFGLSEFSFDVPVETSLTALAIYPNPFVLGRNQRITFDHLPDSSYLQIYTLPGELVTALPVDQNYHRAYWLPDQGLRNWNGREIASGLYLAVVSTPTRRGVFRFAIVR
jgi:streptogramin lyase